MVGGDSMRHKGHMQDLPQWTKDGGQWGNLRWKVPCHLPMARAGALKGWGVGDRMQRGNPRV